MKKIFLISCALLFASALFAQTSYKNVSTAGMFKTDVDKFMDVHSFRDVELRNLFTYVGYNGDLGGFSFGLAHQFKKFYFGMNFDGELSSFQTTSSTIDGKNYSGLKAADNNGFEISALFGFEKIGILASFYYKDDSIENVSNDGTTDYKDKYELFPEIKIGATVANEKRSLDWYFAFGFDCNVNLSSTESKMNYDNSKYILNLDGGIAITRPENEGLQKEFDLDLYTRWTIFPLRRESDVKTEGEFDNLIGIVPAYSIKYVGENDKFGVKLKGGLPVSLNFTSTPSKVGGNSVTQDNLTYLTFSPALNLGGYYNIKEGLVSFNAGVEFTCPKFGWLFGYTKDADDSKNDVWSCDFKLDAKDSGNVKWYSGFTCNFGKIVVLDCYYNVLGGIFNNMSTTFTEGDVVSIWNTLNKVLIHNISLMVSLKL